MARMNFSIRTTWQDKNDRVQVSIVPPDVYEVVRVYRRLPAGSYTEFANFTNVSKYSTYTGYFNIGVSGGEYEIQVRAYKSRFDTTYDEDYGYVFVLPESGSQESSRVMTATDISIWRAGRFIVNFYIGKRIGGLIKTFYKSYSDTFYGISAAITDPLGFLYTRLTGWSEPAVGDYFTYRLAAVGVRTVGTIRYQDYDSTTIQWRRNLNGVYVAWKTKQVRHSFPMFRDQDRYK